MAHNMRENDKALAVRTPMWHAAQTNSVTLASAPTRAEAESHVSAYQVIRERLYRENVSVERMQELDDIVDYMMNLRGHMAGEDEVRHMISDFAARGFTQYEEQQLNVRSDTGSVFGAVPTERVDPQPAEVWDIADFIMQQNKGVVIETAGTYNDGADMYILLKLDEMFSIKGDPNGNTFSYNALQNAWYQGKGLRNQLTNVRIQCNNTSSQADFMADAQGVNLSLAHTLNLRERIEEIKEFMAHWREGIELWRDAKEELITLRVNRDQTNWFIDQFIPERETMTERARTNMDAARLELITELYNDWNVDISDTALGLFEAASSYYGHVYKAMTPMTRFKRAMLTPTTVLADAARLAKEAASV